MSLPSRKSTLLVITSETSEADRLLGVLRDDGQARHSVSVPNAERLSAVISQRGCDLILCCGYDRDIKVDEVLNAYRAITDDVPLVLITDAESWDADVERARRAGARGIVRRGDHAHLRMVVGLELADLYKRRASSGLMSRLDNCEQSTLSLIEVTHAGVSFIQDGLHIDANAAYVRILGYRTTDDLLAIPFLDLIAPTEHRQIRDLLKSAEQATLTGTLTLDVTCMRADSTELQARLLAAPAQIDDEPCLRIILQPVLAAAAAPAAERQADGVPAVSGLSRLLAEIERNVGENRLVTEPFAIFYVQVANSAELRRELGLTIALSVFEGFGRQLTSAIGSQGLVSQVSDEGFGVILANCGESQAKSVAEELKEKIRDASRSAEGIGIASDCEVGFFVVRDRASAAEDILNAAYRLCVGHEITDQDHKAGHPAPTSLAARVKQEGEDDDAVITRKIRYALHNNQLRLVYQPIISLMGDNQENYSVLLRLLDEEEKLLEAKDFIGAAIRSGLIEELDKWTIRAAIQVIGEQRRAGHNLSLFVNLSEDTFRNPSIVLWICDCLREFDVRGNWLTFQFQEELVVGNLASISKLVETLKKFKCRVAINRFGVSERPEMLLQGLSLDFVLLKPSFSQGLADDPGKQQRLLQLATLAREFNVKSIVTGVEEARALTVLWTAGVDYVQGNFLQRPSPTLEVQA